MDFIDFQDFLLPLLHFSSFCFCDVMLRNLAKKIHPAKSKNLRRVAQLHAAGSKKSVMSVRVKGTVWLDLYPPIVVA